MAIQPPGSPLPRDLLKALQNVDLTQVFADLQPLMRPLVPKKNAPRTFRFTSQGARSSLSQDAPEAIQIWDIRTMTMRILL